MDDQTTPLQHKCNDEIARERIGTLQTQRAEDRDEVAKAMNTTKELLGKLDGKMDKVVDTQAEHGKAIAILCTKEEAQKAQGWGAIPPWLKAVIGAALAALAAGSGYTVNQATQPEPAPQTQAAPTGEVR
jgi:hypothetical protein